MLPTSTSAVTLAAVATVISQSQFHGVEARQWLSSGLQGLLSPLWKNEPIVTRHDGVFDIVTLETEAQKLSKGSVKLVKHTNKDKKKELIQILNRKHELVRSRSALAHFKPSMIERDGSDTQIDGVNGVETGFEPVSNSLTRYSTFFTGPIMVGTPPQSFNVIYDTGSQYLLVPDDPADKGCMQGMCQTATHRYNIAASSTYTIPNLSTTTVANKTTTSSNSTDHSIKSASTGSDGSDSLPDSFSNSTDTTTSPAPKSFSKSLSSSGFSGKKKAKPTVTKLTSTSATSMSSYPHKHHSRVHHLKTFRLRGDDTTTTKRVSAFKKETARKGSSEKDTKRKHPSHSKSTPESNNDPTSPSNGGTAPGFVVEFGSGTTEALYGQDDVILPGRIGEEVKMHQLLFGRIVKDDLSVGTADDQFEGLLGLSATPPAHKKASGTTTDQQAVKDSEIDTRLSVTTKLESSQTIVEDQNPLNKQFSFYLGGPAHDENGTFTWGGYDSSKAVGKMKFHDVDDGKDSDNFFWKLPIDDILVGGKSTGLCTSSSVCAGVVDTGTTLIVAPKAVYSELLNQINVDQTCKNIEKLPIITLVINGYNYELGPNDYIVNQDVTAGPTPSPSKAKSLMSIETAPPTSSDDPIKTPDLQNAKSSLTAARSEPPTPAKATPEEQVLSVCALGVSSMNDMEAQVNTGAPQQLILGHPFLRRYLSVFDLTHRKVGLADTISHTGGAPSAASSSSNSNSPAVQAGIDSVKKSIAQSDGSDGMNAPIGVDGSVTLHTAPDVANPDTGANKVEDIGSDEKSKTASDGVWSTPNSHSGNAVAATKTTKQHQNKEKSEVTVKKTDSAAKTIKKLIKHVEATVKSNSTSDSGFDGASANLTGLANLTASSASHVLGHKVVSIMMGWVISSSIALLFFAV